MNKGWSRSNPKIGPDFNPLSIWLGEKEAKDGEKEFAPQEGPKHGSEVVNRPIEPGERKSAKGKLIKWAIFLLLIGYALVSFYRAPILTRLGRYLIVEQPLKKADFIVCMLGKPVERGLAAAQAYNQGLAPLILLPRENLPDGNRVLKEKGVHYPESRDLLMMMLQGLGVPRSACYRLDRFVESSLEEATVARDFATKRGYHSLIVVTSPYLARRTRLIFKKVFEKGGVKVLIFPSPYSGFRAEDWWKSERYVRKVIGEYEKLLFHALKFSW